MNLRPLHVALAATLLGACSPLALPGAIGEQCELNSDCDAPLVCRFGYCRVECDSARDCAVGFDCIFDNEERGACQLEADLGCALNSDCAMPLVCTMGECTNRCNCPDPEMPCPDCAPGAACVTADDGSTACLDTSTTGCVYDSDCPTGPPFEVCAQDGRCRVACDPEGDDCRNGERCLEMTFDDMGVRITGYLCLFMGSDPPP
jgi:hypothetical protein